jgi:hypothetical protein
VAGDPRRGYRGSYALVRDYLAPLRVGVTAADPAPQLPKAREVTSWIMSHPDNLNCGTRRQFAAILAGCPELAAVQAHVAAFADLMTQRRVRDPEKWIIPASGQLLLRPFTDGLARHGTTKWYSLLLHCKSGSGLNDRTPASSTGRTRTRIRMPHRADP